MGGVTVASTCTTSAQAFVKCLSDAVLNPLFALIFAAGMLVFIFGIIEFMWEMQGGEANKQKGKQHMLWGIIGMFIMVASYTILSIIAHTLGPEATQYLVK